MVNNRKKGNEYEDKACEYLKSLKYEILDRNFHGRGGEIDIIARDGNFLVFAEVKYRSSLKYGYPQEAVDYIKQNRIRGTARDYIFQKAISFRYSVRFDVIAILGEEITHIKDAF